jgi:penicillin G amidase
MRRWLAKARAVAAIVIALLVIASVASYLYLRRSLPQIDGTVAVSGISAPIEIVRDADAIPHIFATTLPDALFGLGYVHAQDRLWQIEFQRRIGHGRLSEIFGAAAVPQDRFLRTVGFGRAAQSAWEHMAPWAKAQVNAYVAGVNAFIAAHRGAALPPEFTLLRFRPEPWSGADVVVWVKMMAWDLSANYSLELLRDDLVRAVGMERMQQLMAPASDSSLSILGRNTLPLIRRDDDRRVARNDDRRERPLGRSSIGAEAFPGRPEGRPLQNERPGSVGTLSAMSAVSAALSEGLPSVRDLLIGGAQVESLGSNNWVVDGTLSATGKPLLANDPHLGAKAPSTWYLAHISTGDLDLTGATLPGTPAIALGRNGSIAWGLTNVAADVEDLYREQLDPSGRFATFGDAQEPLTMIPEEIKVKGGDPVRFDVRLTRHGPLVSDAINDINAARPGRARPGLLAPLALRWTALDATDTTLEAYLRLNVAHNWSEFTAALRDFVVPSQNFVYADVDGHIGYYAPGRIPIRAGGGDGTLPADGWTGLHEWTGWIPFDSLPHVLDPPEHFIVTANNRPVGSGYPYVLGSDWPEPYRATRIVELLRGAPKAASADFARIQADTTSLHARALLPLLLEHARPTTVADQQAVNALRDWNGDAGGASQVAPIFEAWFLRLAAAIAGDELPAAALANYSGRFSFVTRLVTSALTGQHAQWCDDVTTAALESCEAPVTKALHEAVDDLGQRMGTAMSGWRWDTIHRAMFPHQGLDSVAALRPLLSRSIANGGDFSTVNVGAVSADAPYEQRSVAGFRQIVDLSSTDDSRFIIDLGQSGHPLSAHYADFLHDWQTVQHRRMRTRREDVDAGALGQLTLTPRGK